MDAEAAPAPDAQADGTPETPPLPPPAESTQLARVDDSLISPSSGLIREEQVDRIKVLIKGWVLSGQLPRQFQVKNWGDERYRVTEVQAMQRVYYACQALASVRLNLFTYLRFVAHIEGQTMFFGDLPLALARRDKLLACPPEEFWLDKDYKEINRSNKNSDASPFMAVCRMQVAGSDMGWREREYTLQAARDNNKYFKDNDGTLLNPGSDATKKWLASPWAVHTRRMLQMRARSWAIKDFVPECLNAIGQVEYDADEVPAEIMPTRAVFGRAKPSERKSSEDLWATYAAKQKNQPQQ